MAQTWRPDRYRTLRCEIREFAEVVASATAELGINKAAATRGRPPSGEPQAIERVVRDYVARAILSPPDREGKNALYGYRQLVEFVAARTLLNDGWPLDKVAERLRGASVADIESLIPGQAKGSAVELARSFQQMPNRPPAARSMSWQEPPDDIRPAMASVSWPPDPFASAGRRAELPALMMRLTGSDAPPDLRNLAALQFGDLLTVLIDEKRLKRLSVEDAEAIGRAVTAALLDLPAARPKEPRS
jgi:hypothetical protein